LFNIETIYITDGEVSTFASRRYDKVALLMVIWKINLIDTATSCPLSVEFTLVVEVLQMLAVL
jgi:hypothetical protein